MYQQKEILIVIMGGTIDSRWDGRLDTAVISGHSVLPEYFREMILYAKVSFEEVCLKDSRQLTREDLDKLLSVIENASQKRIVITHGTYTMPDTAKFLKAQLSRKDLTIVLTGSMIPLEGFYPTDAPFNLGYSLAAVELMPPGIYLSMNGRIFSPEEVAKNLAEGKFYSVFDKKQ